MKQVSFWAVLILIAVGLQILGRMSSPAKPTKKTEPASVSKIEGTELKRLTLLPEALRPVKDHLASLLGHEVPDPRLVIYSLLLILMMLLRPQGIFGSRREVAIGDR